MRPDAPHLRLVPEPHLKLVVVNAHFTAAPSREPVFGVIQAFAQFRSSWPFPVDLDDGPDAA